MAEGSSKEWAPGGREDVQTGAEEEVDICLFFGEQRFPNRFRREMRVAYVI